MDKLYGQQNNKAVFKKEWTTDTCYNMAKPLTFYAKLSIKNFMLSERRHKWLHIV